MKKRLVSLILAGMVAAGSYVPVFAADSSTTAAQTTTAAATQTQEVTNVTMYRVYNPNSGEHFYTKSAGEKNHLVGLGWRDEGTGWTAPSTSNTPVYRLYNPNAGDHHYTTSAGERNNLVRLGWKDEGIGWYSDDEQGVPVYRQYNPNAKGAGAHNYTTSSGEKNNLVKLGWRDEGTGWYGVNTNAVYVVMNIPYSEFFASENTKGADAVSSATKVKTRSTIVAGSYHVNADGSDISGVSYPVKVNDSSVLKNLKQVTDNDSYDIEVTLKGNTTKTTYKGADALFENAGTHAYYQLSSKPDYYKTLTVNKDGSFSFGKTVGAKVTNVTTAAEMHYNDDKNAKHGDYEFVLADYEPEDSVKVYGAVLHTKEGSNYALRIMENIWQKGHEIAFSTGHRKVLANKNNSPLQYQDFQGAEGQTVTGMTVYNSNGIDEVTFQEPITLPAFPAE